MKRIATGLTAMTIALAVFAGCAAPGPRAYVPEDSVDFGDIPLIQGMQDASYKRFVIQNVGTKELDLSDIRVKMLEGC